MRPARILLALAIGVIAPAAFVDAQKPAYPPTQKGDVVDDYFGTKVPDPYRWMEDLDSKPVADWVAAQNAVTFRYLDQLPLRNELKKRITELWNYPKVGLPFMEAGRVFYRKNSGLQKQSPLFVRAGAGRIADTRDRSERALARRQHVARRHAGLRPDAKLLAYMMSEGGADWQTIQVRDLSSGKDLPDDESSGCGSPACRGRRIRRVSSIRAIPEPPAGKVLEAALSGQALYYHRVGTPAVRRPPDLRAQGSADAGSSAASSPRTAVTCS